MIIQYIVGVIISAVLFAIVGAKNPNEYTDVAVTLLALIWPLTWAMAIVMYIANTVMDFVRKIEHGKKEAK